MRASNKVFMEIIDSMKDESACCYLTVSDTLKMFLGRIAWQIEVS